VQHEVDALFRVLSIHLQIKTNQEWAELLRYSDPSSVSRVRNGRAPFTEDKKRLVCQACNITRRELDLPLDALIERLQIEDDVPGEMGRMGAFHPSDVDLISALSGEFVLLYPGRDYKTGNLDIIISEKVTVDREPIGGSYGNSKFVRVHSNFVTGTSNTGKISAIAGVVYMSVDYPGQPYPPSTYIFEPLTRSESLVILAGLYLDVTGEPRRRIFSTQCCMFNCNGAFPLPRSITSEHPLHARWKAAMSNQVAHRGKLLAQSGEEAVDELSSLVIATRGQGATAP
jgi:hypothetical protein